MLNGNKLTKLMNKQKKREKEMKYLCIQAWLDDNFKKNDRPELVIYQSDNVLTPQALKEVGYKK